MPWLVKAEAYDAALPGIVTHYFSDVGVVSGAADTPAHTYWQRRVSAPPSLARAAYGGNRAGGRSEADIGTVSLANLDGALDALAGLVWDGHTVTISYAEPARPAIGDFAVVLLAVARHVTVGNEVVFTLAERRDLADVPWQAARFAGTGAAEGGTDWADVRKPRALGICWQVEPDLIDEANLVYAYGATFSGGVMQARDRGVPLKRGGNHPDYATMIAAGFGTADFLTCDALSMIRLKTLPAAPLTIDVLGQRSNSSPVSNRNFTSSLAGWTAGTGWAWTATAGGQAEKTAGTASTLGQTITTAAGAWYAVGVTSLRGSGSGVLALNVDGVQLVADLSADVRRFTVLQATTTATPIDVAADAAWAGVVDDFVVFPLYARAGDMLERILLADTQFLAGDIEAADIAALNAAQPAALGLHTRAGEEHTVPAMLDLICDSVGAYWFFDLATGKFRVRRLDPPGTPDHEFTDRDIDSIAPRETEHRLREITLDTARRGRPLAESEIAAAITEATRRSLATESYPVTAVHADVATEAKLWRDEKAASLFAYPDAGQDEADRRVDLSGDFRLSYEVVLREGAAIVTQGDTVRLTYPRWTLGAGRDFRALHVSMQGPRRRQTLILWG